ncbi:unnamed protein product [Blepharisma stoltei]|uniref:Uncharacterized protein n=1 Tax=Blepharisma stoltei TaxID=1481888 RepID=A0AAU9JT32_9CILI|nr:unnamed protein product [Blepharisma stoltei]
MDSKVQEFDSIWVLSNLWKEKSLFKTKLPLPDTLLSDAFARYSVRWLFTDSSGFIKKKCDESTKTETILHRFLLGEDLNTISSQPQVDLHHHKVSEPIISSYISYNDFHPLTKQQTIIKITSGVGTSEAIQMLPRPNGDYSSRFLAEVRKDEGRNIYKFYKTYNYQGVEQKIVVCGAKYKKFLTDLSEIVIEALQKNTSFRILQATFCFVEDEKFNLWFLGSLNCYGKHVTIKPKPSLKEIIVDPMASTYSFGGPSVYNQTLGGFYTKASYSAAGLGLKTTLKRGCPGSFCNFVIKSKAQLTKDEMDYDDLLNEVRKIYINGLEKEYTRMKLSLRSDYLLKEISNKKLKAVKNDIPYKYILFGKLLLEKSGIKKQDQLVEVDANQLRRSLLIKDQELLEDRLNLNELGLKNPFHYYDIVQVCDRCYEIYKLLRNNNPEDNSIEKNERLSLRASRPMTGSRPMTSKSKNSRPSLMTQSSTASIVVHSSKSNRTHDNLSTIATERRRSSLITPIGMIDKDNIDDLLTDMDHLMLEEELDSKIVNRNINYWSKSLKRTKTNMAEAQSVKNTPLIDTKKVKDTNFEALTMKLFPDANPDFYQSHKKKKNFKYYIKSLKEDKFEKKKDNYL